MTLPISVFAIFMLTFLALSRWEQLDGERLEKRNKCLADLAKKHGLIISKYEELLKEYNDNVNRNNNNNK